MTKLFHECPDCQRREETYTVLFRMRNYQSETKGEMYSDTEDTWVNVSAHETEADLIDTIVHESTIFKTEDGWLNGLMLPKVCLIYWPIRMMLS